ncbi:hypothetical protein [Jiangella endophytica]|uniref:hypothetical protein n=1 Tax=Jiangella endophytica TaxID=1623398 RepID=UPI0013005A41|nr:hypothetical protein [Jiangella endophytica]
MITRAQVLARRAAVSGLSGPRSVLLAGVQGHPTGTTARLAVALRGGVALRPAVLVRARRRRRRS